MRRSAKQWRREAAASDVWMRVAWAVMLSLLVILALTPVSQTIWTCDNLFQPNGDTEYTLYMSLTMVSLALLLSRQMVGAIERAVDSAGGMLAVMLSAFFREPLLLLQSRTQVDEGRPIPLLARDGGSFRLPLLI